MVWSLIASLPKDYKKTVKDLQQYLTDEVVSDILSSPDYLSANNMIFVYLANTYGEHLTTFFSVLETIKDVPALTAVINRCKESKVSLC